MMSGGIWGIEAMTREQKADVALWDYATRDGATYKGINAAMKKDGFTLDEIISDIGRMTGEDTE